MSKFESKYFDDAVELLRAKDDAWEEVKDRRDRLKIVRSFTNMLSTLTDEEAEELGRSEITNYGLTYNNMLQQETQFTSMVTVTNSLCEVIVDTDNSEKDLVTGVRISEAINRGAIHFKGKFQNFWRKVSGEITIAGGGPVTQNERYGWLPKLRTDMFFPKGTDLDSDNITYAFDPKELTRADLEKLLRAAGDDEDGSTNYIIRSNVKELLAKLVEQIQNTTKDLGTSFAEETSESVRGGKKGGNIATISAWWFYEVKYAKDGNSYVSATLFTDGITGAKVSSVERDSKGSAGNAKIVAYIDKAFESTTDWIHMVFVDSEIGGVKNVDTLKGVAEITYPSNLELEELINLMVEGDKIRSRPKIRLLENADADKVKRWDIVSDLFAPAGVEEMPFKNDSRSLMTPMSLLTQNSAALSGGAVANGPQGGELRQQAVERQRNSSMVQANRVSDAYNHLDAILETVVWRLLAGETKPGVEGYNETMWVRAYLDRYGIDYKSLASRKHGRFQYIRVRAKRTVGNGDRQNQIETSDWLMKNLQNYPPGSRPALIHKATVLRTQDPDEADMLVKIPRAIINAQKVTAENEYDVIKRRAALGQVLPIADDDIHQDHIPVHLLDMQAHLSSHSVRPWDKMDLLAFAGMTQHVSAHLQVLLENPVTNPEGKVFIQDFQNIVQAAQAVVAEVEERTGNDQAQLTPMEQAQLQLQWAKIEMEGRKLGVTTENMKRLWANQQARSALSQRAQYTKEIAEDRRLAIDAERMKKETSSEKTK